MNPLIQAMGNMGKPKPQPENPPPSITAFDGWSPVDGAPDAGIETPMLAFAQPAAVPLPINRFREKHQQDVFRKEDGDLDAQAKLESRYAERAQMLQARLEAEEMQVASLQRQLAEGLGTAGDAPQYAPAEHSMGSTLAMLAGLLSGKPQAGMAGADAYRAAQGERKFRSDQQAFNAENEARARKIAILKQELDIALKERGRTQGDQKDWDELYVREQGLNDRAAATVAGRSEVAGANNQNRLELEGMKGANRLALEKQKGKNAEARQNREMQYKYDALKSLDAYRKATVKLGAAKVDQIAKNAVLAAQTKIMTTGMVVSGHDRRQIVGQEFERGLREAGLLLSPGSYRMSPEQQIISNEMSKIHTTIGGLEEALTEAMALDDQEMVIEIAKRLEGQRSQLAKLQERFSRPLPSAPAGAKPVYPNDKRPSKPG